MGRLGKEYAGIIIRHIDTIMQTQAGPIDEAAAIIAESIRKGGLLHLFGCGHSHILVEEVFYRAGGLVPVNPILETSVMLHEGAVKSSKVERMEGYAPIILDNYEVKRGEVMIVISTSGINGLPIDMAMEARRRGLYVIAITSSNYFHEETRHSSGKKLYEIADLLIDSMLPHGDALVEIPGTGIKMAPGSTVIGALILNMLMATIVEKLVAAGDEPPVFMSGNIEGGFEKNKTFIEKYRSRIKHL